MKFSLPVPWANNLPLSSGEAGTPAATGMEPPSIETGEYKIRPSVGLTVTLSHLTVVPARAPACTRHSLPSTKPSRRVLASQIWREREKPVVGSTHHAF